MPTDQPPTDPARAVREPPAGGWDRELLVDRYGTRRAEALLALADGRPAPRRRAPALAVVAALLLGVAATYGFWAWRTAATGTVAGQLVGYTGTGTTSLTVTWQVSRDPGSVVACTIGATAADGAVVGQVPVQVNASSDRTARVVTEVRTVRPAANATVDACRQVTAAP